MKLLSALSATLLVGAFAAPQPVIQLRMSGNLVESLGSHSAPDEINAHQTADFNADYDAESDHVFNCRYEQPGACHMPTATATDHHDDDLAVSVTRQVVDNHSFDAQGNKHRVTDAAQEEGTDAAPSVICSKDYVHKTQIFKYDAQDLSGNKAEQITVAFFIYDMILPNIHVCGSSEETVEGTHPHYHMVHFPNGNYGNPATSDYWYGCAQGSTTAEDEVDGDLNDQVASSQVKIMHNGAGNFENGVLISSKGTWTIDYSVTDFSENTATARKTIHVVDTQRPTIHMNQHGGAIDVTLECGVDTYTDAGAVCTDRYEGPSLDMSRTMPVNVDTIGTYNVVYSCHDAFVGAANPVTATRNVVVQDSTAPVASLKPDANGNLQAEVQLWAGENIWQVHYTGANNAPGHHLHQHPEGEAAGTYVGGYDLGANCADECSTTTQSIAFVPEFDSLKPRQYVETYTCTDAVDRTHSVTRTIDIVDNRKPLIILNGNNPQKIEAAPGLVYNDAGATCTDEVDGDLSQDMVVKGQNVNAALVGSYEITYDCTDSGDNKATSLVRTVVVEDNTIPTIKMNSKQFMVIEASFPWEDPGATAWDTLDGLLTVGVTDNVDPFASVHNKKALDAAGSTDMGFDDPDTTGVYHVVYTATDSDGNDADNVIRTVVVKDTLPPVITITHDNKDYAHAGTNYNKYPFSAGYDDSTYDYLPRQQRGSAYQTGIPGMNPGGPTSNNGYVALNEESSSNNKQIAFVAGLALAVGGVALLALKKRNTQAKTFVMV